MKEYESALQSYQQALMIILKLHGKEHPDTAKSYHFIGMAQLEMKDYELALQSYQQALNITLKLHGELGTSRNRKYLPSHWHYTAEDERIRISSAIISAST